MPKGKDTFDYNDIEIALTLSGGGYRASIFHIGVLSYLHHLKLGDGSRMLDHITIMSTVSGGTITGLLYLLSLKDNNVPKSLNDIYNKIVDNNLANYLLENVNKKKNDRKLSVIKELGNVYDTIFFNGEKFDSLYQIVQHSHVHHYAAYATDITNAMPFRFQVVKSEYGDSLNGNEAKSVRWDKARNYRIADILAASSCFPIVFEPINHPRDFKDYNDDSENAQSNMRTLLMDGGIVDNQGIDYLLEVSRRMSEKGASNKFNGKGIDLAIVSDAASNIGDNQFDLEKSKKCFLKFLDPLYVQLKDKVKNILKTMTTIARIQRFSVCLAFILGLLFYKSFFLGNKSCKWWFACIFIIVANNILLKE